MSLHLVQSRDGKSLSVGQPASRVNIEEVLQTPRTHFINSLAHTHTRTLAQNARPQCAYMALPNRDIVEHLPNMR